MSKMEFSMKLFVISILLTVSGVYSQKAKKLACNGNTVNEVDKIIHKINPIGNSKVTFPETIPEAKKHCKTLAKPMNTLEDLNKRCIKGMMKEVVGVVVYNLKKKRQTMCKKKTTSELRHLVDSGKCVNLARFDLERCANSSIDRFMAMKEAPDDQKIPLACCEISLAKKCMLESMNKVTGCSNKHQDTLVGHFNSLSGGALNVACNDYKENSDKCHKLKSIKLNIKPGAHRSASLVMSVIEMFKSLDKED